MFKWPPFDLSNALFGTMVFTLALSLMGMASPAHSQQPQPQQPQCVPNRQAAIDHLAEKYGEQVVVDGILEGSGSLFEVLMSPLKPDNGATFSVIVTSIRGETCLVASGDAGNYRFPDYTDLVIPGGGEAI